MLSALKDVIGASWNKKINVSNLFECGEYVPWPGDDSPGFLSPKHCRNLWTLGARPNMDSASAQQLFEDVLTCAHAVSRSPRDKDGIYLRAYSELVVYLKALFVFYNDQISDGDLAKLSNWNWGKYINRLQQDSEVDKVHIISFNYDIWLERFLKGLNIDFTVGGLEADTRKFRIYKPHGSIGFVHKNKRVKDAFEIPDFIHFDSTLDEYSPNLSGLSVLDYNYAIIPPAGDSNRALFQWATPIRDLAKSALEEADEKSIVLLIGLSYWHVDRWEIDSYLSSFSEKVVDIKVVNPFPPAPLAAVVSTLFSGAKFFTNNKFLEI